MLKILEKLFVKELRGWVFFFSLFFLFFPLLLYFRVLIVTHRKVAVGNVILKQEELGFSLIFYLESMWK